MKMFILVALLAIVAGCGFRITMSTLRGGETVLQTDIAAGFDSSASRDNSLGRYDACLVEVGGLPDRETFCADLVANELRLEQRYLECASGACYDPYGFRQYVSQPR